MRANRLLHAYAGFDVRFAFTPDREWALLSRSFVGPCRREHHGTLARISEPGLARGGRAYRLAGSLLRSVSQV